MTNMQLWWQKVNATEIPDINLTSRENPSARYSELIGMCTQMHEHGDPAAGIAPEEMFKGISLPRQAPNIKEFIQHLDVESILDYGCGKATQYDLPSINIGAQEFSGILDYWSNPQLTRYDPAYKKYSSLPAGVFDVVISTDVLEHCPEEDMGWIIREMFAFAKKGLFANVATYPARKKLPNGENAHVTLKPAEWWARLFTTIHQAFPDIRACIMIEGDSSQGTLKLEF